MADFYVDSAAAGANDGTSPTDAWVSIASIPTLNADTVWVRRTHSETLGAGKAFVGTANTTCKVVGWPISGDDHYDTRPAAGTGAGWDADASGTLPTITETGAFLISIATTADVRFEFHRLAFVAAAAVSTDTLFTFGVVHSGLFKSCTFDLEPSTDTNNKILNLSSVASSDDVFEDCTFTNGTGSSEFLCSGGSSTTLTGTMLFINCTVNGCGRYTNNASNPSIAFIGCSLGETTPPGTVYFLNQSTGTGVVTCIGSTFGTGTIIGPGYPTISAFESVHHDGTINTYYAINAYGTVESTTSVTRSGGASYSIIFTPTVSGDENKAAALFPVSPVFGAGGIPHPSWSVVAPASETTVSVYLYSREWSTLPTPKIRCWYISNATTGALSYVDSAQTFSANATWTEFSCTFTPAAAGLVYIQLVDYDYEAGSPTRDILIDPLPVVA